MENSAHSYTEQKPDWKVVFEIIEKQYANEQLDSMIEASRLVAKYFSDRNASQSSEIERLTKENEESLRQRNSFQGMYDFTLKENTNLRAEIERLREALREIKESFAEYCKHRKDKGTAVAKLNAWNHLLFRINDSALQPQK